MTLEAREPRTRRVVAAAATHVGRVRTHNEDAYVVAPLGGPSVDEGVFDVERRPLLLAVSDGMGGAHAGEVASALVVESLKRSLAADGEDWDASLRRAVERANVEVWTAARRPETHGMGATLTAVCIHGDHAHVAEVGDSRAYLLRDKELRLLTHDQSYVQVLLDAGVLSPSQAEASPMKNVILAAMGGRADVSVDIGRIRLEQNERLLVCSDGLSNELSADEIRGVLVESATPQKACAELIARANERGGNDNITVIVAEMKAPEKRELEPTKSAANHETPAAGAAWPPWLNRTVWGMAITSFLSDLGHEAQTTILPTFMGALGLPPAALGAVEGIADATSSFVKLGAGWFSDRIGRRKPFVVLGYLATGLASGIIALATAFPGILAGKLFGWFGRGVRSPLRDAMLTDAIPEGVRGRAFGFHRFGDTLGAVLGPALAVTLLYASHGVLETARRAMWWSLVPGVLSALAFALLVGERVRPNPAKHSFQLALRQMPTRFRRYLVGVSIFGAGDFAHSMLILAATQLLTPSAGPLKAAAIGGSLYVLHNVIYAAAAYPAGALADRYGAQRVLAWGYSVSALVPLSLLAYFSLHIASVALLAASFTVAGLVNGVQDTLEGTVTASLAPNNQRGLAFGLLGATNGVGDLVSSVVVGALWSAHSALGFGYAAALMAAGAVVTHRTRKTS